MENKMLNIRIAILLASVVFVIGLSAGMAAAVDTNDVLVWQGQYHTGTTFHTGTYDFDFTVYDALTGGVQCYSNVTSLATGNWGEWRTEQYGVSAVCSDASKSYFLEISIDGEKQSPRRRLTMFNFLRKNVNETTIGTIAIGSNATILSPTTVESHYIKAKTGLKELNKALWALKLSYAAELANTTLFAQEGPALTQIAAAKNMSLATVGESIELKKARLNGAAELAKALIDANTWIARAKIGEARELALLNGETEQDGAEIEEEARLKEIALNLTAIEKKRMVDVELNSSLAEVEASDDGIRFCLSDGTNCMGSSGNPFNQVLNTTSDVTFNNVTANTGFFGWLGSLTNRITKLWVVDVNATGNIETSQNVSANYFKGDGSLLTNLPAGGESDPQWSANFTNMQTDCSSNNYAYGVNGNGTLKCRQDQTGGGLAPVYLGSDLNATNAARVNAFTIALTTSKMNVIHAYLAQSSSANGVAIQNRAIVSASGPVGNCHFATQTGAGGEALDNIVVSNNSADTGVTAMGLDTNVPFINTVTCAVLADANQRNLTIQFISETASTVTTYAGSYYTNAVS